MIWCRYRYVWHISSETTLGKPEAVAGSNAGHRSGGERQCYWKPQALSAISQGRQLNQPWYIGWAHHGAGIFSWPSQSHFLYNMQSTWQLSGRRTTWRFCGVILRGRGSAWRCLWLLFVCLIFSWQSTLSYALHGRRNIWWTSSSILCGRSSLWWTSTSIFRGSCSIWWTSISIFRGRRSSWGTSSSIFRGSHSIWWTSSSIFRGRRNIWWASSSIVRGKGNIWWTSSSFFRGRRDIWTTSRSIFCGRRSIWWTSRSMFCGGRKESEAPGCQTCGETLNRNVGFQRYLQFLATASQKT